MDEFINLKVGDKIKSPSGRDITIILVFKPDLYIVEADNGITNVSSAREFKKAGCYLATPEKTWPQLGVTFFRFNSQGEIIEAPWTGSAKQLKFKEFGNVFRTEEEAKQAVNDIQEKLNTGK